MADLHAILLAGGDLGDVESVRRRLADRRPAVVIAADGGARHAAALGLRIDRLIGDLDSLPPVLRDLLTRDGTVIVEHPPEKDETDLELALLDARRLGVRQTIVLGGVGGRLDMTLANVGLLLHPVARDMSVELWHGLETAYVLSPPGGELPAALGDRISLIPFGGDVHRITTHALAFPLRGESLTVGPARGVSNRVTASRPRVEFASGALLVVHAPADPEEVQGDDPHDP